MEDLIKLKTAMDLIVTGLYEKERQKNAYSAKTEHSLRMSGALFR